MVRLFRRVRVHRVGAQTNTGKVRDENQDHMSRFLSPLGEVFVVADGMGGHRGGSTAAGMVTHGFEEALGKANLGHGIARALQEATSRINAEIFREAHSGDPATEKMGSTVVLAILNRDEITIGHVGDSRAYLLRDGSLRRLTRDHSSIQKMIDRGFLSEQEARAHPDASVLNRNMGGKEQVDMEVSEPILLKDGDAIMLCTDGLCGYAELDTIGRILCATPEAQQAAEALVHLALDIGGEDNVTVQIIQYGRRKITAYVPVPSPAATNPPAAGASAKPSMTTSKLVLIAATALGSLLLVVGGIFIGVKNPLGWGEKRELPPLPDMDKKSGIPTNAKEIGTPPSKSAHPSSKDATAKVEALRIMLRFPIEEKGIDKVRLEDFLKKNLKQPVDVGMASKECKEPHVWYGKDGAGKSLADAALSLQEHIGMEPGHAKPISGSSDPKNREKYAFVIELDQKSASALSKKLEKEANSKAETAPEKPKKATKP